MGALAAWSQTLHYKQCHKRARLCVWKHNVGILDNRSRIAHLLPACLDAASASARQSAGGRLRLRDMCGARQDGMASIVSAGCDGFVSTCKDDMYGLVLARRESENDVVENSIMTVIVTACYPG